MKDKNKRLMIIVGSLLLVVGISLAYFTASIILGGDGSSVSGSTATVGDSTLYVEGSLSFNDLDIYPGHQNISSIKVTATGNNELIPYNVIWEGTNTLNTPLNYYVYKTSSEVDVSVTCEDRTGVIGGSRTYYEECSTSNSELLGEIITSGTISSGEEKKTLIPDEFITSTSDGTMAYYYVILEYPNLDEPQNSDIGGSFSGDITIEISDIEPDINIIAAYIEQEDGSYEEVSDIPQSGYTINTERSTCSNGATPMGNVPNITINNLSKSGTSCYLYFDKEALIAKDAILAGRTPQTRSFPITTATTVTGTNGYGDIYQAEDDDGITYYFAGNPTNNWVSFAGHYWRIIRINGDGTIRMIYSGTGTPQTTGTGTQITVDDSNTSAFNPNEAESYYVGLKYTASTSASTGQHGTTTESTILQKLNTWYTSNISTTSRNKIDINAGFCGDRTMDSNTPTWSVTPSGLNDIYYAGYERLKRNSSNVNPIFKCSDSRDLYTVSGSSKGNKSLTNPIGLITADEIVFAGGSYSSSNSNYYLYTSQDYWTMSPSYIFANFLSSGGPKVFIVTSTGRFYDQNVHYTYGIRPVINLRADVTLKGNGTASSPYEAVEN